MNFFLRMMATCLFLFLLVGGSVHAGDPTGSNGPDSVDQGTPQKAMSDRMGSGCSGAFKAERPAGGCGNASKAASEADTNTNADTDTDADTGADTDTDTSADEPKFEGSYNLTGIIYHMGGNDINAGNFLGQLGTDWFGEVTVSADGHIEVDFTMPEKAAQMAGQFSLDILEITEDAIQVTTDECETESEWVNFSINGDNAYISLDVANFCKSEAVPEVQDVTFQFEKVAGPDMGTDTPADSSDDTGHGSGSSGEGAAGGGPGMTVPVSAVAPVQIDAPVCMISSLINSH